MKSMLRSAKSNLYVYAILMSRCNVQLICICNPYEPMQRPDNSSAETPMKPLLAVKKQARDYGSKHDLVDQT